MAVGETENVGSENDGPSKSRRMKIQDMSDVPSTSQGVKMQNMKMQDNRMT